MEPMRGVPETGGDAMEPMRAAHDAGGDRKRTAGIEISFVVVEI